jgi:hypothetical protein
MKFTETKFFTDAMDKQCGDDYEKRVAMRERFDEKEIVINATLNLLRTRDSWEIVDSLLSHCIQTKHMTDQQSIIRNLYKALRDYGTARSDLRNEAAVNWAKKVTEEPGQFPYI